MILSRTRQSPRIEHARANPKLLRLECALRFALIALCFASCAHSPRLERSDPIAITNLVHRYAHHYDAGRFDDYLALFTEDMEFQFETMPPTGIESLAALRERNARFVAEGIQRRHVMTNLVVEPDGAGRAKGATYFTLLSHDGERVSIVGTGRYEFHARKTDRGWRLDRWRILADGTLSDTSFPPSAPVEASQP